MRTTPNNITELAGDEIFVFGSNLNGAHAGGAARLAYGKFGAVMGQGEGLQGQSYAFPTLGKSMEVLTPWRLEDAVKRLYRTAEANPKRTFLLTKVGCGIAGIDEERMKKLFAGERPDNIVFPAGW